VTLFLSISATALADVEDDLREGDKYFEQSDWKKAGAAYDSAIKKYPSQVPAEAYGKRAAIFFNLADYDGGLKFVHDVAEKQHPGAPEVLQYEAAMLWQLDKKGDAIAVAEKAAAGKPSSFIAQRLIGQFYASRDAQKTATAYEAYLQYRPSDQEKGDVKPRIYLGFAYLQLAGVAHDDNDDKLATQHYVKAVAQFDYLKRKLGKEKLATNNANLGLCAAYTAMAKYDQAITICEQITRGDKKLIDANASPWFNLGKAYLKKKQFTRTRASATEYLKVKPKEAKGYLLIGDAYFQEKNFQLALENYLQAEKLLRPNETGRAGHLAIQMGQTYAARPFNGNGKNPNLTVAFEKLEKGRTIAPEDSELAKALGNAYLRNQEDGKALSTADGFIKGKKFDKLGAGDRGDLLVLAAKALYNLGKLKDAREHFTAAYKLQPKSVQVRRGLVQTIEVQAYQAFKKQDYKAAGTLLDDAAEVDGSIAALNLDRGVISIVNGDCEGAQKSLAKLEGVQGYSLVYERLIARTYLCIAKPNPKKAAEHYAAADKEVKKVQSNLLQAEINTEWAPLLIDAGNLEDAVSKLEDAVQFSSQAPWISASAKRNLAVALYRRGWKRLKDGKSSEAASDFERAGREPALLEGTEPLAFEFSYALALLDKGDTASAAKLFKTLAAKGQQSSYLKPPYSKNGTTFFAAYASYRGGSVKERAQAAKEFESMSSGASGSFAQKIKDLLTSSYEFVAYDAWRNGKEGAAEKALTAAAKSADGDLKKRIQNDKAVLDGTKSVSTFENLGSSPPEALVNLGVAYDAAGKPKEAYEAWTKAAAKGASAKDLKKWIDAKKRIYGFN
jgi:hypothetical protein